MKRGKKYVEAAKLVDRAALYDTAEAIDLVQKTSTTKFDATVKQFVYWYSQKATKLKKLWQLVRIS